MVNKNVAHARKDGIMVSSDTFYVRCTLNNNARIESELEVKSFLQDLRYALDHGAKLRFQENREVDHNRKDCYTNRYTVAKLFPNEDPKEALASELKTLTVAEYMNTVKDMRFPYRSEMREFGKVYNENEDVYIKIRVELFSISGSVETFVMSFHYAETPFTSAMFPYKR